MPPAKLILLASALTLTALAGGQSPSQPAAPTLKVYSRETIVDVTVTDSKGKPVHGLQQEDFTVKEDGKPEPIRSFEEFHPDASEDTALPDLPPNTYSNRQPPAAGPINILLLDSLNIDPTQVGWAFSVQTRVKQDAKQYLKTMPSGTRVILLGLSKGLHVLQSLSSDPELLSAAVDTMGINIDARSATMKEWGSEQDMHNRMTLEALDQIATDVASIKGKKNLIWFSADFPPSPTRGLTWQPVTAVSPTTPGTSRKPTACSLPPRSPYILSARPCSGQSPMT
jgi:VWFA-related protein